MPTSKIGPGVDIVKKEHELLLEALRHREQAIIQYLAILGPALGGFVWLLQNVGSDARSHKVFAVGTLGVIAILWLGAMYSVALGYNFRYITLVLAKIEKKLDVAKFMLKGWPRSPQEFKERYCLSCIPWCAPPEIIWIFWVVFLFLIAAVAWAAVKFMPEQTVLFRTWGVVCLIAGLIAPIIYGCKLRKIVEKELLDPEGWKEEVYE